MRCQDGLINTKPVYQLHMACEKINRVHHALVTNPYYVAREVRGRKA